jgi:hypothetical protein
MSPARAAAPGMALAELGAQVGKLGAQIHTQAVGAEREMTVAKAITDAVLDAEKWVVSQKPYDEDGNPRHEEVVQDWEVYWSAAISNAASQSDDPKVQDAIHKRLLSYGAAKGGEVIALAQTWHIKEQLGKLYDTLDNMVTLAAASPESIATTISTLEGTLDAAVRNQLISKERANQMLRSFTKQAVTGRVRLKLATGDYLGASIDIRHLQKFTLPEAEAGEFVPVDLNTLIGLAGEHRAEVDRATGQAAKDDIALQEAVALNFVLEMRAGNEEATLAKWEDISGPDGIITDLDLYTKVRNAAVGITKGENNQAVLKDAYMAYAYGNLTPGYLVGIKKELSTPTFGHLAGMARSTAQVRAKEGTTTAMWSDPVFKDARDAIKMQLAAQGRAAMAMTYVEQTIIPIALRDFTNFAIQEWIKQSGIEGRTLDYHVMQNEADSIVARSLATIPNRDGTTIRNAPIPAYSTVELVTQAFSKGEFGPIESDSTTERLEYELRRLENWRMRQFIEQRKAQDDSNGSRKTLERPSAGDWLRNIFGD